MAVFTTWILRRRSDAKVLWSKQGAAPPELVVDPKAYQETFTLAFPTIHIQWGPGDYEMLISGADTFKIGPVRSMTAPDFSTENAAMVMAGGTPKLALRPDAETPTVIGSTEARIVSDEQAEANAVLGASGIPGNVRMEEGIPQDKPRNNPPAEVQVFQAQPDAPDYIMLLRNVKRLLLPMDKSFADRLRALPALVRQHVADHPEGINLDETILRGRKFIGLQNDGLRYQLPSETFLGDSCSPKTRTFIRWWANYQEVESQVEDHIQGRQDMDLPRCFQLTLEMVVDAVELYLLEKGWSADQEPDATKMGDLYLTVAKEIQERASFLADKDLEYGQPTRRHGLYGVVIRVFDKISRYTTLKAGSMTPKFESALDSLKDLGGYSMILAGAFHEEMERVHGLDKVATEVEA